ncbi:MAG: FtsQ-type POTRA domain-containing protein, partial [Clostridia bacterium]|nr:FtsQ-type POTRA domain-containing protein [Clostridia bacterium]
MSARRRYNAKRQNTNLAGFVVCLVFVLAILVFLDQNVFVVKRISVAGNKSVSDSDIIALSGISMGQKMRSLDLDKVSDNFRREGNMELIDVSRQWPDAITIEVDERNVVGIVGHLGTAILIDEDC